jgi:hypothetical protein
VFACIYHWSHQLIAPVSAGDALGGDYPLAVDNEANSKAIKRLSLEFLPIGEQTGKIQLNY